MPSVEINYWAIVVTTIVAMVVGAAWYSLVLFGKPWMKEVKKTEEDLKSGSNVGYVIAVVGNLITGYILSHFVDYAGATTALAGAVTGFWAWVAFYALPSAMNHVFEGRSWKLFWINASMILVNLVIAGMILAVWR